MTIKARASRGDWPNENVYSIKFPIESRRRTPAGECIAQAVAYVPGRNPRPQIVKLFHLIDHEHYLQIHDIEDAEGERFKMLKGPHEAKWEFKWKNEAVVISLPHHALEIFNIAGDKLFISLAVRAYRFSQNAVFYYNMGTRKIYSTRRLFRHPIIFIRWRALRWKIRGRGVRY